MELLEKFTSLPDTDDFFDEDEKVYDNLIKYRIKPIGKWQLIVFLLLIGPSGVPMVLFPAFTTSINIPHRCRMPQLEALGTLTYDQITNLTIPMKSEQDLMSNSGQIYKPCLQYDTSWLDTLLKSNVTSFEELSQRRPALNDSQELQCANGYTMDLSKPEFRGSALETFNMVCDRSFMAPLSNTVYLISQTVACLVTGHFSDRYGRKRVMVVFGIIQMISAFLVSFSSNVYMLYIFRMIIGFCSITVYTVGSILIVEMTNSKYRNLFTSISSTAFGFVFGSMFVGAAYLFQDWRFLHAFLGLLTVPTIFFHQFMNESPRWLFTVGRGKEAVAEIQKGIKMNNPEAKLTEQEEIDLIGKLQVVRSSESFKQKMLKIVILFKTREMVRRTSILAFVFFSHGLVYYGTTFYSVKLKGNRYLMFWIVCVFAIPANLLQFILYHKFQRKRSLVVMIFLLVPLFIAVMVYQCLQTESSSMIPVMVGTAIGKLIIDCTFSMIYIYCPEIFPTVSRNTGLGTVAAFSRVGAASAPFIIRLSDDVWRPLPFLVFTIFALVCGLIIMCLPETKNRPLFDTVAQLEKNKIEKAKKIRRIMTIDIDN